MHWKDFLYFQRGSKIGVILLLILIVLTLILNVLIRYRNSADIVVMQNDSLVNEFEEFRQSLAARESFSGNKVSAGQQQVQARSAGRERDLSREAPDYESRESANRSSRQNNENLLSRAPYHRTEKLSEGETILLNGADTSEWKKVPGIGSAYASRIVKYRDLLGGFAHTEQLLEVYGMDSELFSRIAVYIEPDGNFRKLRVNKEEFRELLRHPYLNYKQVQAIMGLRRKKGDITSIRELALLDEFTSEDILRLEPYLEF